jgi:PIN domain nuclease of toxin-antitoxin system
MIVLDTSALLAVLFGEPGGARVQVVQAEAVISAVNAAEMRTKLFDAGLDDVRAAALSRTFGVPVVDFDEEQAIAAAALRPLTRPRGLSLGDRACLALAMRRRARVMTADRAWHGLEVPVEIEVIR